MTMLLIVLRDLVGVGLVLLTIIIVIFIMSSKKSVNLEKNNNSVSTKNNSSALVNENTNLKLKDRYVYPKEVKVYEILQKHFGHKFLIIPKVLLKDIIAPKASRVFFDLISNKTMDFVIFDKILITPVLVIDVFDNTFGDESLREIEKNVVVALKSVRLELVSVPIRDSIVEDKIVGMISPYLENKTNFLNSQPASSLSNSKSADPVASLQNADMLKQVKPSHNEEILKRGGGILTNAGSLKNNNPKK